MKQLHTTWPRRWAMLFHSGTVSIGLGLCCYLAAAQEAPKQAPPLTPPSSEPGEPGDEEPTHPPGLLQHLEFCRTLDTSSPLYGPCLRDAATTLAKGIASLRKAQPADVPPVCPDPKSTTVLDWAKEQGCFIKDALQLITDLRQGRQLTREKLGQSIVNLKARAARRQPGTFTLISQGGVSLGSWQAGYSYILSEVLKQRRKDLVAQAALSVAPDQTATGASAGAINALIQDSSPATPTQLALRIVCSSDSGSTRWASSAPTIPVCSRREVLANLSRCSARAPLTAAWPWRTSMRSPCPCSRTVRSD